MQHINVASKLPNKLADILSLRPGLHNWTQYTRPAM